MQLLISHIPECCITRPGPSPASGSTANPRPWHRRRATDPRSKSTCRTICAFNTADIRQRYFKQAYKPVREWHTSAANLVYGIPKLADYRYTRHAKTIGV